MQFVHLKRRQFITLLGGAAAAWPFPVRAQHPEGMRRVGVLYGLGAADSAGVAAVFAKAIQELGWTLGSNIEIEYRWAAGDTDQMRIFAKELVELRPDLIVGHSTPVVAALQKETRAIPIVFVFVSDPVGSGFVETLPRPGGNITGFINIEGSFGSKWIELLKEIAPHIARTAFVFNPETAPYWEYYFRPFETAARTLAVEPVAIRVRTTAEIEPAIISFGEGPGGSLIVMSDVFTSMSRNLELIISLAARLHLPTIYPYRRMAVVGGLISYGIDNMDTWRRAATYVDRILKGWKPSELPVQLPTKFELVINLKAARAMGLIVPDSFLVRADEVIE